MAEQITIIETTPIPEGMTFEQFDAWWNENVSPLRTSYDAFFGRTTEVLAGAAVPNGRWGDHHISIERVTDESGVRYLYRNGWDDALQCSLEDARRYFNERVHA